MRYIKYRIIYIDLLIPVILLISYLSGFIGQLFMAYLAVLFHEAAHTFAALAYGCKIKKVHLLCLGTRVELDIAVEEKAKNFLIYSAGPAVNFLMAMAIYFLTEKYDYQIMRIYIISNLCMGALNLLPVAPLDGGNILSLFTSSRYGLFYSQKISRVAFLIFITILLAIAVPVALFLDNFSILIIVIFLLLRDRGEYEEAAFMNARNLYYRRSRLLKKGYYGVREIVVLERLTLGEAFKLMDFDQYHLLIILDENMKIIHRMTESELLEALNVYGYSCTFKNLINTPS